MATTTTTTSGHPPHILVFPYPAQGHMLSLLDFTHQLSLRNITITILVTPRNLPFLNPLLSLHPSIQTLDLPFPPHPNLPDGVENVKDIGHHGNIPIINALGKLQDQIILWFEAQPNPPVAIISDFFLGWTLQLANKINIPRIAFFSSGALLASVMDHCWKNQSTVSSLPVVDFGDLPGSPSFKAEHLPSIFRICMEPTPENVFIRDSQIANTSSWGCVFNSFEALEGDYMSYLKKKMGNERVYGVGPLSLIGLTEDRGQDGLNSDSFSEVLPWLDGCPDDSVLYVCFGSQKLLNRQQMEALASGLERSKVRFIWVVKMGTTQQVKDGYGIVPDGFEERVKGRGVVMKGWAPQVLILSHRAVGGFLSHCGWNSVLEGIVAGVRILGWPMEADQHVNARLLVEDMGMAVKVCEGADSVPDSAELGKIIGEAMSGDAAEKVRAKELREKAVAAVGDGGSSLKDIDEFVRQLGQLRKVV